MLQLFKQMSGVLWFIWHYIIDVAKRGMCDESVDIRRRLRNEIDDR